MTPCSPVECDTKITAEILLAEGLQRCTKWLTKAICTCFFRNAVHVRTANQSR